MSLRAHTLRVILLSALLVVVAAPIASAAPALPLLGAPPPAQPTVKSVIPRAGDQAGGDTVTITGTGFVSADTTVTFGSVAATSVDVSSPGKLTAVTPAAAAGTVDVQVTTGGGTSPVSDADVYAFGPPTVSGVAPDGGSTAGGNTVTITGTGFVPGATVRFGGSAIATSVTFVSGDELQAVAPAESAGTVHVRVSTPAGSSDTTAADEYTYGAPAVTGVSPDAGPTVGGNTVTVSGAGFVPGATAVSFGGVDATPVSVSSSTKLTAVAPAGAAGTVDVQVTTTGGESPATAADTYAYGAPAVTAVAPNAGPTVGGNTVTITGTSFVPGATVRFGGSTESPSVTFVSGTELQAVAPAGTAGAVHVRVSTAAGSSDTTDADEYTYGGPAITSVKPDAGPTAGGNTVTVSGTGFVSGHTTVSFGGTDATSVTVSSATRLTAVVPAGAAGTVDVRVTTSSGESPAGGDDAYAYGAPTVTGVSPNSGPVAGGNTVTITGTAFAPDATVRFGGSTESSSVTFVSETELSVVVPAGSAGNVNVRVSTPAGSSDTTTADTYTYGSLITMVSTGPLIAGLVPLEADSTVIPRTGFAAVEFQYAAHGSSAWKTACDASGTRRTYACAWNTAVAPDGSYDLRAISTTFGTTPEQPSVTISNAVPDPTIAGAATGQSVQGQLTLTTNPLHRANTAGISQNLVPNWSMEDIDERGLPVGWRAIASHPGTVPQTPVPLKVTNKWQPTAATATQMFVKAFEPGAEAFAWSYTRRIPVTAGHSYHASILINMITRDSGLYATLTVTWYDAQGAQISSQQGTPLRTKGVATTVLTATAPKGATGASLSPAFFNTGKAPGRASLIFTDPQFGPTTGSPAVNPNVTVEYHYGGGSWQTIGGGCAPTSTGTYNCPVPLTQLADGPVDLRVAALDNAGHVGHSAIVSPSLVKPGITFTHPSYAVHESQGALSVTVTRSDSSEAEDFDYGVNGLTAEPGVDFGAVAEVPAHMDAGQSSYTFQVPITDRGIHGPPLQAGLYLTDSYPDRIVTAQVPLTIIRDDPLQRRGHSNPLGLHGAGHNPLRGAKLYAPGGLSSVGQAQQQLSLSSPKAGATLARIGFDPLTRMLTPTDGSDISATVAAYLEQASAAQPGTVPLLATHYLAGPRCTRAPDSAARQAAYRDWIKSLAYGIGNFRSVVFLESGATATSTCMSAKALSVRATEMAGAVKTLEADPHVVVYIDGGASGLRSVASSARLLKRAGVGDAQGFFLNAPGYDWVTSEVSFGQQLSARLHRTGFVIDTSQDGRGPAAKRTSCKQHDRGLGPLSTQTGYTGANALLWITGPGISDGSCPGSPAAGTFWSAYAVSLVAHAVNKITGPHYRLGRASHFVPYGAVQHKRAG